MKKTPWIPGNVKPVRVGVYQRHHDNYDTIFSRWDGEMWYAGLDNVKSANSSTLDSAYQQLPWRGLAQDPSKR
jgi:hypothetical protein